MKILEDEINELHKSNTQLESEMSQLKAQISNMENKMSVQERENQVCAVQDFFQIFEKINFGLYCC